jgi:glycylpeptide N-tetradecanoyltransferase
MKQELRNKDNNNTGGYEYKFWSTQPVPQKDEKVKESSEIQAPSEVIKENPYLLPSEFEWSEMDLNDIEEIKELCDLLEKNYVEDPNSSFRFNYSTSLVKWALQSPGWRKTWHLGVRVASSKRLVAFIAAIPMQVQIHEHLKSIVEINFLCVHKKLRSKRMTPVLIKEITRRVNLTGIFQAIFTSGAILPTPISTCQYFHRSLNPEKLINVNFSVLKNGMTLEQTIEKYKLPDCPKRKNFRPMEERDFEQVYSKLINYLSKFSVYQVLSKEEAHHFLLPLDDVLYSYVVEDNGEITDFVSFYNLSNAVLSDFVHKDLRACYLWYYFPKDDSSLKSLIYDALILANSLKFDVFNCLEIMDNKDFLRDLKFGPGDGYLKYYLYNWRCPKVSPEKQAFLII